jgi:hypothetical protein
VSAIVSIPLAPARVVAVANLTLSGPQTIDDVDVVAGDRVLVMGQTAGAHNGLYDVAAGSWTRSADFDVAGEMLVGDLVVVREGTLYANSAWLFTTAPTITVNTTVLSWRRVTLVVDAESGETVPPNATLPFPNPGEVALDHDAQAQSRVISQYRNSTNLKGTISDLVAPFQALENCLVTIPQLDDPAVATGVNLDVTGELVGQIRTLADGTIYNDADYRILIGARILRNRSIGSSPEFLDFLVFVFGATPFRFFDLGGMSVGIEIGSGAPPPDDQIALLDAGPTTRAMAVGVIRVWYDPAEWFAFAEDTAPNAKGFGEIGDPTKGGGMAEIF